MSSDGIPVAVTCQVLQLARQPYYRWLNRPVTDSELVEAYRANALFDAHHDDPEFRYRFLADEAGVVGESMAERTAWRICSTTRWWSRFGKRRRGKSGRPGPPVHDDLVRRVFTAKERNRLWPADISEHRTGEGKLYICAFEDVFLNRIVGYSIDSRKKSSPCSSSSRYRRRLSGIVRRHDGSVAGRSSNLFGRSGNSRRTQPVC